MATYCFLMNDGHCSQMDLKNTVTQTNEWLTCLTNERVRMFPNFEQTQSWFSISFYYSETGLILTSIQI